MTDIPQWALDKAAKAVGWERYDESRGCFSVMQDSIKAHAATIAKYEKPPVDPDLERARALIAEHAPTATEDGVYVGKDSAIKAIIAALKEGRK